jgi:hypothetical protein
MSKVYVGARIPVSLHQRLSEHIEKTGASKSEVIARGIDDRGNELLVVKDL